MMVETVNSMANGHHVPDPRRARFIANDLLDMIKHFGCPRASTFTHLRSTLREENPKTFPRGRPFARRDVDMAKSLKRL